MLKFGLSEKHTKILKNLPHGYNNSADLLSKRQKHVEDFFQIMCASQKVRTLIYQVYPNSLVTIQQDTRTQSQAKFG